MSQHLKPGDVVLPSRLASLIPFGVLSVALTAFLVLAVMLIFVGLFNKPDQVLSSFQSREAMQIWVACIGIWLGLAVFLWLGAFLTGKRRIRIEGSRAIMVGPFGGQQVFESQDAKSALIRTSVQRLGQGDIHLTYGDGSRKRMDGTGFDPRDLERVAHFLLFPAHSTAAAASAQATPEPEPPEPAKAAATAPDVDPAAAEPEPPAAGSSDLAPSRDS